MCKSLDSTAALLALLVLLAPSSLRAAERENEPNNKASATFIDGSGQRRSVQSNETQLTIVRVESGRPDKASRAASSTGKPPVGSRLTAEIADPCPCRETPTAALASRP
jgi:hypothetical protein